MRFPLRLQLLLIPAAFLISAEIRAQKMITFESAPATKHKPKRREGKNALGIGTLSVLNGFTPLYYERTLTPFLTVQAGAGITYRSLMNDISAEVYDDGAFSDYYNGGLRSDVTDIYNSYRYRQAQIGSYLSFSPRFYFRESALDGGFIGPMIEYKHYRYKAQMADESAKKENWYGYGEDEIPRSGRYMDESMRCLDLTVQFGGLFQSRSHVTVSWNIGIGVRSLSAKRLDIGTVRDSYDSSSDAYFSNHVNSFRSVRPVLGLNFIVGGWF